MCKRRIVIFMEGGEFKILTGLVAPFGDGGRALGVCRSVSEASCGMGALAS
jgi:hypothetical protein